MCGGRGTRLDVEGEKPLVEVGGVPMVDRVRDALGASRVGTVHAAVSPHAPATRDHLRTAGVAVVETPGEGYVADLTTALDRVDRPTLTVAADLPLLAATPVNRVLDAATGGGSLTTAVPVDLKRRLGVSVGTTFDHEGPPLAPTGCNVVAGTDDDIYVSDDPRLAVNVNRPTDLWVAEALV
ncbi:NTP transferase domain-containing protein [Haloplanus salilacus]|uniref:NTP transferase domain-containing protein n=1 Tax=Haloplanus salilacus TaxID=2949994 RepID=UPI0030D36D8A